MTGKRQLKFSENFPFWKLFIVYLCASHSPEMEKKRVFLRIQNPFIQPVYVLICKIGVARWGGCKFIDYIAVRIKERKERGQMEKTWQRKAVILNSQGRLIDSLIHSLIRSIKG